MIQSRKGWLSSFRWIFDDDQGDGGEEEKTKAPPKAKDIEEKKEQAKTQQTAENAEEKKEESIVDNLMKPRGRNTDRLKNKGKAQTQGAKLPKVTARMFDEINAQAVNFTIDQQRELIVFELKEQIRAILAEANSSRVADSLVQEDLAVYLEEMKAHISKFLDTTLVRIYGQFKALHNNADDSLNDSELHMPPLAHRCPAKIVYSQGTQTSSVLWDDSSKTSLIQISQEDKNVCKLKILEEEKQLLLRTASKSTLLLQTLLKQLTAILSQPSLTEEGQKSEGILFTEADLTITSASIGGLVAKVNTLSQQLLNTRAEKNKLVEGVRVLLMENEQKGNFIVEMQKKFKARKSMLYKAMKQSEVVSKEKEILKAVAKTFLEESSHYQSECDRLSLEVARQRADFESEMKSTKELVDHFYHFLNSLAVRIKQENVQEAEKDTAVTSKFKNLQTLYSSRLEDLGRFIQDASRRYLNLANNVQGSLVAYDNEIRELHEQLAGTYDQRRELNARITKLTNELNSEKQNSAALQNKLKEALGQVKIKEEELDQIKQEFEDTEIELTTKREELANLSSSFETSKLELNSIISQQEEKYSQTLDKLRQTVQSISYLLQPEGFPDFLPDESIEKLEELGPSIQRIVEYQIKEKTSEEAKTSERFRYLEKLVKELETENEELKSLVKQLREESLEQSKTMESKFESTINSEANLVEEISGLRSKLDSSLSALQTKEELISEQSAKIIDLETKVQRQDDRIRTLNESIDDINRQLQDKQHANDSLRAEKEDLEQQIHELSYQKQQIVADDDQKPGVDTGHSEEIEKLRRELREQREAKESAMDDLTEKDRVLNKLELDFKVSLDKISKLELDIGDKQSQIDKLEENLSFLKAESEYKPNLDSQDESPQTNGVLESKTLPLQSANEQTKELQGLKEMHEHMEIQNRRIELLLMDLEEAHKAIKEYRQEREDLKSKVLNEIREVAESNKEAKDFLMVLLQDMQK